MTFKFRAVALAAVVTLASAASSAAAVVGSLTLTATGGAGYSPSTQIAPARIDGQASFQMNNTLPATNVVYDYSVYADINIDGTSIIQGSLPLGSFALDTALADPTVAAVVSGIAGLPASPVGFVDVFGMTLGYDFTFSSASTSYAAGIVSFALLDDQFGTFQDFFGNDAGFAQFAIDLRLIAETTPVPIPAALPLMLGAFGFAGFVARRRS